LEKLIRTIPVRDANGTRLTLFEFRHPARLWGKFGVRFISKRRRMQLDTGEAVEYVDENTFKLASGETLRRIDAET
jgi:hypothetical protein